MPLVTIFTPTYNRASFLPRLYESLKAQTCLDFEWIIVDDGSTDNTKEVVSKFGILPFFIRYCRKLNEGKHSAINVGLKLSEGKLFFIVDSDDMLPSNSVETIKKYWEQIEGDNSFAGVCGLDADKDGNIIGSGLPKSIIDDNSINVRFNLGITGDMKEVFRTDVLWNFPFPEIEGEKFCPEVLVWNRIAAKYKLRYFNKVIYIADYQPNGLTSNIIKSRMNSPIASMMTYQEMTTYKEVPLSGKIKAAINYWRFRLCYKSLIKDSNKTPRLAGWLNIFAPLGWLMHLRDTFITNRR